MDFPVRSLCLPEIDSTSDSKNTLLSRSMRCRLLPLLMHRQHAEIDGNDSREFSRVSALGWVLPVRLNSPPAALWTGDQITGESLTTDYAKR